MPPVEFDLATPADDAAIGALLRTTALPGAIRLAYARDPSYFAGAGIEGPFHQVMVGRDPAGRIVGMGSRAVRELYVGGRALPVGYMSHLRVAPDVEWGAGLPKVLARGWRFYRALHADGRAPYYLISLVAGESPARRLFCAGLRDWPTLTPVGSLVTYSIAARRVTPPRLPSGVGLRRATPDDLPAIAACLARNGPRRTFTPVWTCDTLCRPDTTPGLLPHHFWLAVQGDRIVGCLARWDQQPWKQTVVQGYAPLLGRLRPWVNLAARVGLAPRLPPVGGTLRHSFAALWAVDDDDAAVGAGLLAAVIADAAAAGDDYLMVGLDPSHPLGPVVTRYRHVPYRTEIHLATWGTDPGLPAGAVGQIGPEIAVL